MTYSHVKPKMNKTEKLSLVYQIGCLLQISKALSGLKGSGNIWHRNINDTLRDMGLFPFKAETDVWMRTEGNHYHCICVYVDDFMHMSKNKETKRAVNCDNITLCWIDWIMTCCYLWTFLFMSTEVKNLDSKK